MSKCHGISWKRERVKCGGEMFEINLDQAGHRN
jgi:hypothetical protein